MPKRNEMDVPRISCLPCTVCFSPLISHAHPPTPSTPLCPAHAPCSIAPRHVPSCPTMSCRILAMSHHVPLRPAVSHRILPRLAMSHRILPCPAASRHVPPHLVMSRHVSPCSTMSCCFSCMLLARLGLSYWSLRRLMVGHWWWVAFGGWRGVRVLERGGG